MSEEVLSKNQELDKRFRNVLSPEGNLVAAKFLTSTFGYERMKLPQSNRTLCQYLSQVRYVGRSFLVPKENYQSCYLADRILGFKELKSDAHERYVGWQMGSAEAAKKTFETISCLDMGKYEAVYLAPLGKCIAEPDSVVFLGNASQALVLVAAYLHNRGGAVTSQNSGMGVCSQAIVSPFLSGELAMSIPGNAWKLLGLPSNTDLVCGIPGNLLQELADNAEFMRTRGGSRYPVAWQYIDWEVQSPIADLIVYDGKPTWLKK